MILDIDHVNLSRIDLNLLNSFDALFSERSVTRAAERIGIGQPSMSHALGRLRRLIGDDLFVRVADGVKPTPRALALAPKIREALDLVQQTLLRAPEFDPANADRTFFLGMPDAIEVPLLPKLMAFLQHAAPSIRLRTRGIDRYGVLEQLDRDRLHMGIAGLLTEGGLQHKRRKLYQTGYVCLYDPTHLKIEPPLSLEDYLSVPHVLGSPRGDAHGVVDDALAAAGGLSRTIAVVTPHFAAIPFLLKGSRLISTIPDRPARMFARQFGLATCPVPVPLPDSDVSMIWHASYDGDPAHKWLRESIVRLAADL
ncbi:LysR family transcriptional regulator [Mesorhizobium sp. M0006]|uniref:LysR family transcriptional regulator n=1 Tax=Mesorhizobium sp. M0006 TaxID=2956838 RepID=UPI00333A3C65